jgi:hypothetical protein
MKSLHLHPAAALALAGASALPLVSLGSRSVFAANPTKIGVSDEISGNPAALRLPKLQDSPLGVGEMTVFGPLMRHRVQFTHRGQQDDNSRYQKFAAPCANNTRSTC